MHYEYEKSQVTFLLSLSVFLDNMLPRKKHGKPLFLLPFLKFTITIIRSFFLIFSNSRSMINGTTQIEKHDPARLTAYKNYEI